MKICSHTPAFSAVEALIRPCSNVHIVRTGHAIVHCGGQSTARRSQTGDCLWPSRRNHSLCQVTTRRCVPIPGRLVHPVSSLTPFSERFYQLFPLFPIVNRS